jgi:hypothetical protein
MRFHLQSALDTVTARPRDVPIQGIYAGYRLQRSSAMETPRVCSENGHRVYPIHSRPIFGSRPPMPSRDNSEARKEAAEVLRINPGFTIESYKHLLVHKNPEDVEHRLDGLRKAGLPNRRCRASSNASAWTLVWPGIFHVVTAPVFWSITPIDPDRQVHENPWTVCGPRDRAWHFTEQFQALPNCYRMKWPRQNAMSSQFRFWFDGLVTATQVRRSCAKSKRRKRMN